MKLERRPPSARLRVRGQSLQGVDATSDDVSFDPARYSRKVQIVLGGVVLVWIGCVGTFVLHMRPSAAPDRYIAIPALAPAADVAANSPGGTIEGPGRFTASFTPDLSRQPNLEAVPLAPSATIAAPETLPVRPKRDAPEIGDSAPLPPRRPVELGPPAGRYDRWTAVYVISAHRVYLPDGTRLEAHSGLGDKQDDPRYVSEPDRGATPPDLYELTPREELFHGVQALRLNPVGEGDVFGRTGLLAHSYMLGPKGDSNGCVSFKDYDAFLRAYQNGQVKRLAVVARLD
jgi:hypothetical protein